MSAPSFVGATPATWSDLDKDQRVAAIRALAGLGHTSTQIAAILSTTRHAVHGVAHRARITISERVQRPRVALPVEPPVSEDNWLPIGEPVSLLDRREDQCAWPVGPDRDRTCCGGKVHAKSFCEAHYAKAYRPAGPEPVAIPERPTIQPGVNRHDRRALMHGGKAQHFEGAE
jgi:hypothetical protein